MVGYMPRILLAIVLRPRLPFWHFTPGPIHSWSDCVQEGFRLSCRPMRHVLTISIVSLLLSAPALAFSQAPAATLSFEVATIKPADPINPATILSSGKLPHVGMTDEGSRVDIGYMTLADLFPEAFNVKTYQHSALERMNSQQCY